MVFDKRRLAGSATAAVVVAIGLTCVVNGAQRIGRPFPGFLVAQDGVVMSVGLSAWSEAFDTRIPFSRVVAVVGSEVEGARGVLAYAEGRGAGEAVPYRFRKGADLFAATVPTRLFTRADFLALYANYFLVGLGFALAGLWTLWRVDPSAPGVLVFFALCQAAALCLVTAGDVYGPYWFTVPYIISQCAVPALALHFAAVFPEPLGSRKARTAVLAVLYAGCAALAAVMVTLADNTALFLPLVYTVYLLLANSILLYLGRLLISRSSTPGAPWVRGLDFGIAAVLLALSLPAVIFVIYPIIEGFISPVVLVAPIVVFPVLTAAAVRRTAAAAPSSSSLASVRLRLSFLFLAAVETAFLAGIAYFWLGNSWQQLVDDQSLFLQQQVRVEHIRRETNPAADDLSQLEPFVPVTGGRAALQAASEALARGDKSALDQALEALEQRYRAVGRQLEARRTTLSRISGALVVGLVVVGVLQAVAFTVAVRRWLIRPIGHLSEATSIIATGDLGYRSRVDSSEEFASLAQSINAMAASLAAIQQRVDAERTAREQATATARDGERRRLARELHDGVLQDLSAVKLAIEGEARRNHGGRIGAIVGDLIHSIVGLRRVVDDLRPQELSHVSLAAAIGNHADSLARRHGVELDLDVAGAGEVPDWAVRDLYRIAQEAVTNAIRHGEPEHLSVHLRTRGEHAVLEVSDDGAGFDPTVVVHSGLASMAERAAALGGGFELRSSPGGGTTVTVSISTRPPADAGERSQQIG